MYACSFVRVERCSEVPCTLNLFIYLAVLRIELWVLYHWVAAPAPFILFYVFYLETASQVALTLVILLSQPPECRGFQRALPGLGLQCFLLNHWAKF